ncbi:MAG: methylated-DNA--[protein]-cysteine S-methyltransferase [Candidatus Caldatribacterium sp.]|uniref:methylated-DNA--[protein]-cysteine S-methyltransferase n=1 Tax=Candidatus Caldatribacterium sp. TaxID=2282143 RepID=UPI0029935947|nr:methylated-DNA--[protein]-cysteine S-methyltransferase [Candidatus Caldatribacterium sp.]MCX7729640.1 methylated-DNA--[protein]-cysteine S-methyltransferase [Candidatus Caldatribacterium sp.]MDW8081987.1 methylated-DNA--[protein]-cysteine S-methyltransferase [Candidatus Calescibacterium sp.]
MVLSVCFISTRLGLSLLGWREKIELFILPQKTEENLLAQLDRWGVKKDSFQEALPPFPAIVETIQAYFEGMRVTLSYPLALERFPLFTRRTFDAVARIPYGTTLTYKDIAKKIALPHASRAVGRALGRNPLPLFIPCHRVVGKYNLGGFSGYGLRYKILLLSLELSGSCPHSHCSL